MTLKITGHLFYVISSFVHHFKATNEFKLELQSGNARLQTLESYLHIAFSVSTKRNSRRLGWLETWRITGLWDLICHFWYGWVIPSHRNLWEVITYQGNHIIHSFCILGLKLQCDEVASHPEFMIPWWRHQMEIFSTLLAFCAGNSPVTGEFPSLGPVTRSFDVFFDLRLN